VLVLVVLLVAGVFLLDPSLLVVELEPSVLFVVTPPFPLGPLVEFAGGVVVDEPLGLVVVYDPLGLVVVDVPLVLVVVFEPLGFLVEEPPELAWLAPVWLWVPLVCVVCEDPSVLLVVIDLSSLVWVVLLVAGVEV